MFIVSHNFTKSRNGWMAEKLRVELKDKIQPVITSTRYGRLQSWSSEIDLVNPRIPRLSSVRP